MSTFILKQLLTLDQEIIYLSEFDSKSSLILDDGPGMNLKEELLLEGNGLLQEI